MLTHNTRVGWALTGSFCTLDEVISAMSEVCENTGIRPMPIMSAITRSQDTRFGKADDFAAKVRKICGREPLTTIAETEPIGPKGLLDLLIIAPCTGGTLSKIAAGITDGAVTMAAKAQLRNERPVLLAIATNDALSGAARSIGELLARRHIYFVPFGQDDPFKKPRSCIADFSLIKEAAEAALNGVQLQPMLRCKK